MILKYNFKIKQMNNLHKCYYFLIFTFLCIITTGSMIFAQSDSANDLSIYYEELTAPDFVASVQKSEQVCILPIGILEKHGPHLPLGTDLFISREIAVRAAMEEYTVIFPSYYFGQINEAKHQPGTIAYSHEIQWNLLQETLDELSRNGFKKIIIVSTHGGNIDFLKYFCMSQLEKPRDYALVYFTPGSDSSLTLAASKLLGVRADKHAGEGETSCIYAIRPDLVQLEKANTQTGENLERLKSIPNQYTGIWWYASFPNHYEGASDSTNATYGNFELNYYSEQLSELIKILKSNNDIRELQNEFYEKARQPLKTVQ
jgi:creatinine amidohydrolase